MKLLKTLLPLVTLLMLFACSKDENDAKLPGIAENKNKNLTSIYPEAARLEFPKLKGGQSILLVHKTTDDYDPDGINYSVEWDTQKKSQRWSCYQMTKKSNTQIVTRYYGNPQYPYDPELPEGAYFPNDLIYSSGFDHGHICPSNDRRYSSQTNYQTFYLTNMQPQYKVFNGSAEGMQSNSLWLAMENYINGLVGRMKNTDTLYVCRGGTIDDESRILMRIDGRLIVPKYFFSASLLKNSMGYKAIAFWFEHSNNPIENLNLSKYVVNIRELETLTGIDFFCNLDDETEERVETLGVENIKSAWGLK